MMTKVLLAFAQYAVQKIDTYFVFPLCFLPQNVDTLEIGKTVLNNLTYCRMHLFGSPDYYRKIKLLW